MTKYMCLFTTEIRGQVTIEAESKEEAEQLAEEMATSTLNYDELTDGGKCAPDVDTEFDDIMEVEQ